MYCSSGPVAPRAGSRGLGLPRGAETTPRSQARLPFASTCTQGPRAQAWRLHAEPSRGVGRRPGNRPLDPSRPTTGRLPSLPARPDPRNASPTSRVPSDPYLTSFGSRPVSLRIFSSTFLRLSLAFSSCSCKALTATAIFSLQQASRLLYRPRSAAPRPPLHAEGLTARPSQ